MKDHAKSALTENNELLKKLIKTKSLSYRFLMGLAYGLGATLGVAVLLAIVGFILSKIQLVPVIGGWLSEVINAALSNVDYQPLEMVVN